MSKLERFLFISSRPIYPIIGGDQIRTAQQLSLLRRKYDVDVLFLTASKSDLTIHCIDNLKCYSFYRSKLISLYKTILGIFNNKPLQVNYYYDKKVQQFIDDHIDQYDAVFCNNIRTAEYVLKHKKVKKYMDFVDAISMNYEKARKRAIGLKKIFYSIDFNRVRRYEQKIYAEFDKCAIISDVDRHYIAPHGSICLVGNAVVKVPNEKLNNYVSSNLIVFVGKMSYEPNIVAVSWFVRNVFPEILKKHPCVTFQIVGANPGRKLYKLLNQKGVEITGFVDTVEPYFQNATIVIAPMLTGAGIQNKIIQAMSYGCCVVTTTIGAEGIDMTNEPCVILNTKDEWIEGINALMADKNYRIDMGHRGREYVERCLSSRQIEIQFDQFVQ